MKSKYRFGAAPIVLAILVVSLSCRSRGTSQSTYLGSENGEMETLTESQHLSGDLEMIDMRSERRDDRLFVQFQLHNKRNSNLAFEWSVEWFDARGFVIPTEGHWTPESIGGKAHTTLSFTGPTPSATSWRLGVRAPNSVH